MKRLAQVLAQNVRNLRNLHHLSQLDFAAEVGISKTVLCDIEKGEGNPTLKTIEKIASAFHIYPSQLLCNEQLSVDIQIIESILRDINIIQKLSIPSQALTTRTFNELVMLLRPAYQSQDQDETTE